MILIPISVTEQKRSGKEGKKYLPLPTPRVSVADSPFPQKERRNREEVREIKKMEVEELQENYNVL